MSELAVVDALASMKERHGQELRDVQYQGRQRVKAAKAEPPPEQPGAVAAAKAENERAEDEVTFRHKQELEALELQDPDAFAAAEANLMAAQAADILPSAPKSKKGKGGGGGGSSGGGSSGDSGDSKKSKAQKKREKEQAKEREREARIAAEKAGAGPSPRELELAAIAQRIGGGAPGANGLPPIPPLIVHEVLSDGHCLYRSVAHQLSLRGRAAPGAKPSEEPFLTLRRAAADQMRQQKDDFAPFLDLSSAAPAGASEDAAFEMYCAQVETSAEWGGHPELLALSRATQLPVRVHAAQESPSGPVVVGWDDFGGAGSNVAPLELTYHRHFYALGEHYNSTAPV